LIPGAGGHWRGACGVFALSGQFVIVAGVCVIVAA
jgi:hypothetical protein